MTTEFQIPAKILEDVNGVSGGDDQKIQKPRLYLEPLTPSKHLDAFHELWTYEETLVWFPFPIKKDVSESREFLEKILPNEENPDIEKFALMLLPTPNSSSSSNPFDPSQTQIQTTESKEDGEGAEKRGERRGERNGEMIGFVGTNRYKEQGMEVGYVINRRYWGMGFATEGLRLFLDMYWNLPQRKYIHRLVGKTSPGNVASQNILVKCGARKGERLKDVLELWVDGGRKSDLICWFLDRPGVEREDLEVERGRRSEVLARVVEEGKENK
ncbi:hypothetical protein DL98DRAFT_491923 [Cadophora sp. DSE1049]|nr:hypothetical protein DL98DRAFT_491923 [Cadophora sp. DSE1049]